MLKVNCAKVIKDLADKPIPVREGSDESFTIGKALANILVAPRQNRELDAFKSWELAKKLYKGGDVELDDADVVNIKKMVETDKNYGAIVIGQILEELNKK